MINDYPLISCICITRAKPHLLQRAINCFLVQTYPNKELIILYEEDDELTKEFFRQNSVDAAVRVMEVNASPKKKLGALRNMAIGWARGEFICQWDDDDWYHMRRLDYQYSVLSNTGYEASLLTQWLIFDSTKGNAYASNIRLWEGSILCRRKIMQQTQYEHIEKGEDTAVIDYLKERNFICEIRDRLHAYIYVYHGGNTWHLGHWSDIFRHSEQLPEIQADMIRSILDGEVSSVEGSLLIDDLLKTV